MQNPVDIREAGPYGAAMIEPGDVWRGRKVVRRDGTSRLFVKATDELEPMSRADGYVPLSRAIMSRHLRRALKPSERVLFLDGDVRNLRVGNMRVRPLRATVTGC